MLKLNLERLPEAIKRIDRLEKRLDQLIEALGGTDEKQDKAARRVNGKRKRRKGYKMRSLEDLEPIDNIINEVVDVGETVTLKEIADVAVTEYGWAYSTAASRIRSKTRLKYVGPNGKSVDLKRTR